MSIRNPVTTPYSKLFSDHLVQSSRLLFLSISELKLLIQRPEMESLSQETCNKFRLSNYLFCKKKETDLYSYTCNVK